jgi:ABC-2 type transport system permease protein
VLTELIRFEWRYHTRQPSFIVVAALFLILGFVFPATGFGPANVAVTAPWLVMETMALVSLFSVFGVAIFVANAVIRDREYRFEEIVYTTPVRRVDFVIGRMGGALAAGVTSLALAPIGMMLATRMPALDRARVGPLSVAAYVWPFLVVVIPTLLFVTALLFAVATLTRNALATYTASVFVYLLYMFAAAMTNSPLMAGSRPGTSAGSAAALLDPFALSTFFEMTRYWTAAQKNHAFVALSGALLVNRVLWIAIALALSAFGVARTSVRAPARPKRGLKSVPHEDAVVATAPYRRVEPAAQTFATSLRAWQSATKLEIRAALRSKPFVSLLALWFALATVEIRADVFSVEYGASLYPATELIFQSLLQPLSIIGIIIVIYYGSELFWREQQYRVAPIIDATPVRGAVMALSKWSALVALIAAVIVAGIVAGVVIQLTSGYSALQPALYLSLFYFAGLPLALYAAAAVAIHALSPGKYAGLAVVLLFIIGTRNAPMIGLEHPLWQFGSAPSVPYSAMYGFGASAATTFGALMLEWSAVAVCMIAVAGVLWRGLRERVRDRFRLHGERAARRVAIAAVVVGVVGSWGVGVRSRGQSPLGPPSTTRQPPPLSPTALLDWKEQYERRYRAIAALPQPHVIAVHTTGDFFPDYRRARFTGDYTLVNDTSAPLRTIVVSLPRDVYADAISIPAAHAAADARFGMYRFDLSSPLPPHARSTLHFDVTTPVDTNGAIVMSFATFPTLGYRAAAELSDPRERAKRALGKSSTPQADDTELVDTSDSQRVAFDATLSTAADQTAVTTGELDHQWSANGRRYFHYRADAPVRNRFAFISGRYAIRTVKADGVDISVGYHPEHSANVASMLKTAAQTVDYCSRAFAKYPHHQLKLVEAPASWNFGGYALPDTILFSETRTFLVDARDPNRPDLLTRRVAHEVAHQWWGYQLIPASRAGATTLTESLAKYTELVMLERLRGPDQVRTLLEIEHDRYLAGRSRDEQPERTLANAGDQQYLYYSKGALVLHAVRRVLGEPALNVALRRLIEQGGSPTTADLLRQLRAVSTAGQYAQIDRWFNETGPPAAFAK